MFHELISDPRKDSKFFGGEFLHAPIRTLGNPRIECLRDICSEVASFFSERRLRP